MKIKLMVEVELRHVTGKFESAQTLAEAVRDDLDSANPSSLDGPDNGGEYEVTDWTITIEEPKQ